MGQYTYSLEPLVVPELTGAELVRVAARAGYQCFGTFAHAYGPEQPLNPAVNDPEQRAAMRAAIDETGVRLANLECFNLLPGVDTATFSRALEFGAEMGASSATAIIRENPDLDEALGTYQRLCDMAGEHGIRVNVEFFTTGQSLPTIDEAAAFVRRAGRRNSGLVIDALHLERTSGGLAGLDRIDPEMIGWVQICDGMLAPPDDLKHELRHRLRPGEGEFPLREMVERCPAGLPLGIESVHNGRAAVLSAEERAVAMRQAAGAIFD